MATERKSIETRSSAELPSLTVVMPAFNEGAHIRDSIVRTHRQLRAMTPRFEIVAVDDGSSDGTGDAIDAAARELDRVVGVRLEANRGKGEALREGFARASGELVFFLDADMDLPPEQMDVFLKIMRETGADVVIGSKRHPDSRIDYPFHRRVISWIYFTFTRLFFGLPIRDTQTGMKVFRRDVLARCMPRMLVKKFAYDLELLVISHHYGYRIAEAPVIIEFHPKLGFIPWRVLRDTAIDTLAIFYRLRLLKYYDASP